MQSRDKIDFFEPLLMSGISFDDAKRHGYLSQQGEMKLTMAGGLCEDHLLLIRRISTYF